MEKPSHELRLKASQNPNRHPQLEAEALGNPCRPLGEGRHPPGAGDRRHRCSGQARLPPPRPTLSLRTALAVHDPPRNEHQYVLPTPLSSPLLPPPASDLAGDMMGDVMQAQ